MQEHLIGYKKIFDTSEEWSKKVDLKKEFEVFREGSAVYHFLGGNNSPHLRYEDKEAIGKAMKVNYHLYQSFRKQGKSQLGYINKRPIDAVESRHMMMMTLLFSSTGLKHKHVVEIGGGFGNWTRLAQDIVDFDKWTIIDLPFVSELQKWFLEKELEEDSYQKVDFVTTESFPDWKKDFEGADVVIGAHSLNEFALEDFEEYFESVVKKCEFFFYATPVDGPSLELVEKKNKIISDFFKNEDYLLTEDERVYNIVYKRK